MEYVKSQNLHGTGCSLACMLEVFYSCFVGDWGMGDLLVGCAGSGWCDCCIIRSVVCVLLWVSRLTCSTLFFFLPKAAIAAQMALRPDLDIIKHVKAACQYVEMGIRTSAGWKLGKGNGPINHFHSESEMASLRTYTYREEDS